MATPGLPSINNLGDIESVKAYLHKLDRRLNFLLEGGLDTRNIREFGGWYTTEDSFASLDDDVGFSTAEDGIDPLRIWAGSTVREAADFKVYRSGKMVATDGEFTGDISASTIVGTAISASTMSASIITATGISASTISSTDISASTITGTTMTASTITATGITGGTITGTVITASSFVGGSINIGSGNFTVDSGGHMLAQSAAISGKIYHPSNSSNYLTVGGAFSDLIMYYLGSPFFTVYNEVTGVSLKFQGSTFVYHNAGITGLSGPAYANGGYIATESYVLGLYSGLAARVSALESAGPPGP